jgi:uncharacterized membrane protein YgdD (TMEM256/DUF423 family)
MQRLWVGLGALAGLGTVAAAAVASHALTSLPPASIAIVQSAIQMEGWHALALLAVGLWAPRGGWLADAAGIAFISGLLLFCGALYVHGLTGVSLGVMAPTGGTLCLIGWLLLAASAIRPKPAS